MTTTDDVLKVANNCGLLVAHNSNQPGIPEAKLLAFARQVEAEALEKAAKVCESRPSLFRKAEFEEVRRDANLSCARAIRALSPPAGRQGGQS